MKLLEDLKKKAEAARQKDLKLNERNGELPDCAMLYTADMPKRTINCLAEIRGE